MTSNQKATVARATSRRLGTDRWTSSTLPHSPDHDLGNIGTSRVDGLDALGADELALRQLEDVLDAIDDLEAVLGEPLAHVARAHPPFNEAIRCQCRLLMKMAKPNREITAERRE